MTKARAIRLVTADDKSLTTNQIKALVKERFGLDVGTNHVIEILGPYKERRHRGEAGKTLTKEAEKYLNVCDNNRQLAVQLINSVAVL